MLLFSLFLAAAIIVLLLIGAVKQSVTWFAAPPPVTSWGSQWQPKDSPTHLKCLHAFSQLQQAWDNYRAQAYARGYADAEETIALSEFCSDAQQKALKGYALSARAFNEHALAQGDAQDDLRQANVLLMECETIQNPDDATKCERQKQMNLQAEANWNSNQ